MLVRLLIVLLASGCDLLFQLQRVDPIDAVPEAPDAPLGPWEVPTLLTVSTTADEADPSLTGDGLVLMFSSNRPTGIGGYDFYIAKRETVDAAFDTPLLISELSTAGDDFGFLTDDGLTVYLNRGGDIMRAMRANRDAMFGPLMRDDGLSTPSTDYNPAVSADGMFAVTDHDVSGSAGELFLYARAGATWGPPQQLIEISSTTIDAGGSLDRTGLLLAFHSERVSAQGRDIYLSERSRVEERFTTAQALIAVNSPMDETDPHVTSDARRLVFARGGDLYESTR